MIYRIFIIALFVFTIKSLTILDKSTKKNLNRIMALAPYIS